MGERVVIYLVVYVGNTFIHTYRSLYGSLEKHYYLAYNLETRAQKFMEIDIDHVCLVSNYSAPEILTELRSSLFEP